MELQVDPRVTFDYPPNRKIKTGSEVPPDLESEEKDGERQFPRVLHEDMRVTFEAHIFF